MLRKILVLTAILSAGGCAARVMRSPGVVEPDSFQVEVSDRLYFGRNIPGGGSVSESDWATFLADFVTPRFPAGLSVLKANGQWRSSNGVIEKEESYILDLLHPGDTVSDRL